MGSKPLGVIKKIPLREVWKDEAKNFTVWLEENIVALNEALGLEIEIQEREHQVGSFSLDLRGTTEQGETVIIENQLAKTDHTHLGQLLTYLTNLQAKIAIWITSEPRQEHINVVNWLNEQTDCRFYLVKIEAISIDSSSPAPLFSVISEPDEDLKTVAAHNREFTEREKFNVNFWTSMMQKCKPILPHFSGKKASKYHFHGGTSGKAGLTFTFLAASSFYGLELYIDVGDSDENEAILKTLMKHKSKIESDFGHPLVWDFIEEKRACRIRYVFDKTDIMKTDVEASQARMIESMSSFEGIFRPLIRKLDAETQKAAA